MTTRTFVHPSNYHPDVRAPLVHQINCYPDIRSQFIFHTFKLIPRLSNLRVKETWQCVCRKYNLTFTRNKPPLIAILVIYVLIFIPRLYNKTLPWGRFDRFWYRFDRKWGRFDWKPAYITHTFQITRLNFIWTIILISWIKPPCEIFCYDNLTFFERQGT